MLSGIPFSPWHVFLRVSATTKDPIDARRNNERKNKRTLPLMFAVDDAEAVKCLVALLLCEQPWPLARHVLDDSSWNILWSFLGSMYLSCTLYTSRTSICSESSRKTWCCRRRTQVSRSSLGRPTRTRQTAI